MKIPPIYPALWLGPLLWGSCSHQVRAQISDNQLLNSGFETQISPTDQRPASWVTASCYSVAPPTGISPFERTRVLQTQRGLLEDRANPASAYNTVIIPDSKFTPAAVFDGFDTAEAPWVDYHGAYQDVPLSAAQVATANAGNLLVDAGLRVNASGPGAGPVVLTLQPLDGRSRPIGNGLAVRLDCDSEPATWEPLRACRSEPCPAGTAYVRVLIQAYASGTSPVIYCDADPVRLSLVTMGDKVLFTSDDAGTVDVIGTVNPETIEASPTGREAPPSFLINGNGLKSGDVNLIQNAKRFRCYLGTGNDSFRVYDFPGNRFFAAFTQLYIAGGGGEDTIAAAGPMEGIELNRIIDDIRSASPRLRDDAAKIMGTASTTMETEVARGQSNITSILQTDANNLRLEAEALMTRIGQQPMFLAENLARQASLLQDQVEQRLSTILRPWDECLGRLPPYNPMSLTNRALELEGYAINAFTRIPVMIPSDDPAWAPVIDGSDGFPQGLGVLGEISEGLDLSALGYGIKSENLVLSYYNPRLACIDNLSAGTEQAGAGWQVNADAILTGLADPLESQITGGPNGTDIFQAHLEAYDAAVTQKFSVTDVQAIEAQITEIIGRVQLYESMIEGLVAKMDSPDPAIGGKSAASLLNCLTIITTNTFIAGAGGGLLIGTSSNDFLIGGAGSDFIFGLNGDDIIAGLSGTDVLLGMGGDDWVLGGSGSDALLGDAIVWSGDDCLFGGKESDLILGEKGIDHLEGGLALDLAIGGAGADDINGNDGNDILLGWTDNDTLDGGLETDLMFGDYPTGPAGSDVLKGSSGTTITIAGHNYELGDIQFGNAGPDSITGGSGIDFQFGNDDNDTMNGKVNIDVMFGGTGNDIMDGEAGGTLLYINGVPVRIGNVMFGGTENDDMKGGLDSDLMFGNAHADTMRGENFPDLMLGGPGPDWMDGEAWTDFMFGGADDDVIYGDNGSIIHAQSNDFIFGNGGKDQIFGENGNDVCFGNGEDDFISGGENRYYDVLFGNDGQDTLEGNNGDDLIFGNQGQDTIRGGSGRLDILFGNSENDAIFGEAGLDLIFGNTGNDSISGGTFNDLIFGNADHDTISGNDGWDVIFGNDGCDTISGNAGVDIVFGGANEDIIHGDADPDLLFGNTGNDDVFGDDSFDIVLGGDGNDHVEGNSHADSVHGGAGNDEVLGGNGPDWCRGMDGNDCVSGDEGVDLILGGNGDDNLHGGLEVDFVHCGDGNDCAFGEDGADFMWGGQHNDILYGGAGRDNMFGGDGNDSIWGETDGDFVLHGGSGDDQIDAGDGTEFLVFGGNGHDSMHGRNGNDWMYGGNGDDRMWGNDGNDKLWGNSGNDQLDGGNGNNVLFGNGGNDGLCGGPGTDILIGGPGSNSKDKNGSYTEDGQAIAACGQICGKKWHDLNSNGERDPGETGIAGVTIYMDLNENGVFNAGEPSVVTSADDHSTLCIDERGCYCFTGVQAGRYLIREVVPSGFQVTYPAGNVHVVTAGPGVKIDGVNFGNARTAECFLTVIGCVFLDRNANGVRDAEEDGLPGRQIFWDQDGDGVRDDNDPSLPTDQNGCYAFHLPFAGTIYTVRLCTEPWPGSVITSTTVPAPAQPNCRTIRVAACGKYPGDVNFGSIGVPGGSALTEQSPEPEKCWRTSSGYWGNRVVDDYLPASVNIRVWEDVNGDGAYQASEPSTFTRLDDPATAANEHGTYVPPASVTGGVARLRAAVPAGVTDNFFQFAVFRTRDGKEFTGLSDEADSRVVYLAADGDRDGIPDGMEAELGTSPETADTDGDGVSDLQEALRGWNSRSSDTDGDGLTDSQEFTRGTSGLESDTDADGMSDSTEVARRYDPTAADADQDGMNDSEEWTLGSNPSMADSDGDGLTDTEERALGSNARQADSDGDGFSDATENMAGTDTGDRTDFAASAEAIGARVGKVTEARITPDGFFLKRLNGPVTGILRVQGSSDLRSWTTVRDIPPPTSPSTGVTVPKVGPIGYYRMVDLSTVSP